MTFVRLLIFSTAFIMTACIENKPGELVFEVKNPNAGSGVSPDSGVKFDPRALADSVPTFQQSVYPIVRTNCINCHSSKMAPFFAQADVKASHDVTLSSFKVNLAKPEASRLYLRLKNDQHNCWSNCQDNAAEMLNAIRFWASKTSRDIPGIKTAEKSFSDFPKKITTISGKTFFEFEEGDRFGRFYEVLNPTASGLKALTTAKVAKHPLGEISTRYGEVVTGCKTDALLSEKPYRVYNKISTHPGPNGYPPYALRLRYWPIRPDRRIDYFKALTTQGGNLTPEQLQKFMWRRAGFPSNVAGYDKEMNWNGTNPNPIFINSNQYTYNRSTYAGPLMYAPILLPDGLSLEEYNAAFASNTLSDDYFALRFNSNYYNPSPKEIRQVLNRLQKKQSFIQKAIYAPLALEFRNQYIDSNGTELGDDIIFTSGAKYFAEQTKGLEAFEKILPLRWENAGNVAYDDLNGNIIHEIDRYVYIESHILDHTFVNTNVEKDLPNDFRIRIPNKDIRFSPSNLNNSISQTISEFKPEQMQKIEWYALGKNNPTKDQVYDLTDVLYPSRDLEDFNEKKYQDLIEPIVTSSSYSCVNCHAGQNSSAPGFAVTYTKQAYKVAKSTLAFNLDNVDRSKFYTQMKAYHNCGNRATCDSLATVFLNSITSWKKSYEEVKTSLTFRKEFTTEAQMPGVVTFKFKVSQEGNFKMLARARLTDPDIDRYDVDSNTNLSTKPPFFSYELVAQKDQENLNAQEAIPVALLQPAQPNMAPVPERETCNKAHLKYVYVPNPENAAAWEQREWKWIGSGTSYYKLSPGFVYTLKVIEGREGLELDQIGLTPELSENIEQLPADFKNPVPIFPSFPLSNVKFVFDISSIVNVPNSKFKVNVDEFYGYYKITEPVIESSQKIWVKDIQIMVNGLPSLNDASFRTVARVVEANSNLPLASVPLLVLKENGRISDKISVLFGQLRKATATDSNPALPVPSVEPGKICKDLPYFEKNILPIFLMNIWPRWAAAYEEPYYPRATRWEDYNYYLNGMHGFHAFNRMSVGLRVAEKFNRCIDCHTPKEAGGVVFNMTKPDFSGVIKDSRELCEEVIKRVNFTEPEMSTILRAINGQFDHPPIVFPEIPSLDSNNEWPNNPDSWNGKRSTWNSTFFSTYEKYEDLFDRTNINCQPQHVSSLEEIKYLKKFIGTYKRRHFVFHTTSGSPALNFVKTVYDRDLETKGSAVPPLSFYENPDAPIDLEQRRNFTKTLYPGEYSCYSTAEAPKVPFNKRVAPQSIQATYPGTNYLDSQNHPGLTAPDGTKLMQTSGTTGTAAQNINILHEINPIGSKPDLELGKEALRKIIIRWIEHERSKQ